ncbi:MAG: riboflavin synthase [Leptonema sp. (in: bacteria)]
MFCGIIEEVGLIEEIICVDSNKTFMIHSNLTKELKKGESVSHNGVCLTVERIVDKEHYQVTAVSETLSKTNLGYLKKGDGVNLERSLLSQQRIDGHFVQGHIDCVGRILEKIDKIGSYEYKISYPSQFIDLLVPRGSIAIDGISLTISKLEDLPKTNPLVSQEFSYFYVNIIPYTYEVTNVKEWRVHTIVNIEFDVLGKYMKRFFEIYKSQYSIL